MRLSKKQRNELVSFVDKEFTYDTRRLRREGDLLFDFFGVDIDRNIIVCIDYYTSIGLYVSITRGDTIIERKFIKTFNELNTFKKMIKCIG